MKQSESNSKKTETESRSRQDAFLQGIQSNAEQEAQKTEAQADKSISDRKSVVEHQVQAIQRETDEKIRGQIASLKRKTQSRISMEAHRIALRERDRVVQDITRGAVDKLGDAIGKKDYLDVLLGWTVEAMIGLDVEQAQVNASKAEMSLIDSRFLKKAEKQILDLTGRKVRLQNSNSPPLLAQGVILEAEGGRVVFNNQISTQRTFSARTDNGTAPGSYLSSDSPRNDPAPRQQAERVQWRSRLNSRSIKGTYFRTVLNLLGCGPHGAVVGRQEPSEGCFIL